MMTPQEVAGCTFTKAVMGGYNMASVDNFLDKLTEDYNALYTENDELKAKMKVLADKLAEYREIEDTMRTTLLTAQKMASNLVSEAEKKRDSLLADAPAAAQVRMAEIQKQVDAEEQRLADFRAQVDEQIAREEQRLAAGQAALRTYIDAVRGVCTQQLELLERLPELPVQEEPVPAPEAEAPAAEAAPEEPSSVEKDIQDVIAAFAQEAQAPQEKEEDMFSALDSEDMESTRVINLDDLQFGRNYTQD